MLHSGFGVTRISRPRKGVRYYEQDLIRILKDEYQCSYDRRTIYSNVDALIHVGFKIKQVKGNTHGYYMEERIFSLPELKLLVDAVQSSKFITRSKTDQLIRKLEGLAGVENAARLQRQVYVHNRAKTDNERVYTNVDIIHSSIGRVPSRNSGADEGL